MIVEEYRVCPDCGQQVKAGGIFCPQCGGKLPVSMPTPPVERLMSQWEGASHLHELCGGGLSLALTISLSVAVLFGFLTFNPLSLFSIFTCIGCWLCFTGGRKKRLTPTGFTFMAVILKIQMVLWFIILGACATMFTLSLALLVSTGETMLEKSGELIPVYLLLLAISALGAIYSMQMRKTIGEAKKVAQGMSGNLKPGMVSIVVLILVAVLTLSFFVFGVITMLEGGTSSARDFSVPILVGVFAQLITDICALVILLRLRREETWIP